jgi:hypothetical protein
MLRSRPILLSKCVMVEHLVVIYLVPKFVYLVNLSLENWKGIATIGVAIGGFGI